MKISDKIKVIENLLAKVDRMLIGGAMIFTFFKAQGRNVGTSKIEEENNNYRFKYPATFRTDDGHLVRSKAELLIDNCLFRHKIAHAYEKKVLGVDEEIFCDFFVDYEKPVYIEFWGGIDDKYLARKEVKKKIYATKTNTALIELTEKDIVILEETLLKKLRPFLPKNFEFD